MFLLCTSLPLIAYTILYADHCSFLHTHVSLLQALVTYLIRFSYANLVTYRIHTFLLCKAMYLNACTSFSRAIPCPSLRTCFSYVSPCFIHVSPMQIHVPNHLQTFVLCMSLPIIAFTCFTMKVHVPYVYTCFTHASPCPILHTHDSPMHDHVPYCLSSLLEA